MRKKLISQALWILLMLALLAACGGNERSSLNVAGNGGEFIKYDDAIYYREDRADTYASSGIWDWFERQPGAPVRVMQLNEDGTSEPVFDDTGYGGMYLYEDADGELRFLLNAYVIEEDDGYTAYVPEIYSVNRSGGDRIDFGEGYIVALDEARSLIVAATYRGGIVAFNLHTQEATLLAEAYLRPEHYDPGQGVLYCQSGENYSEDSVFTLTAIDMESGAEAVILDLSQDDFYDLTGNDYFGDYYEVRNLWKDGDSVFAYVAGYGGSAYMYYDSVLLEVDGQGVYRAIALPSARDWYGPDNVYSLDTDGAFYENGVGYEVFVEGADEPLKVLAAKDLLGIGIIERPEFGMDGFTSIKSLAWLGSDFFFSVTTGTRNEDEDIGWRNGYDRQETSVYWKDMSSGEIQLLYSY